MDIKERNQRIAQHTDIITFGGKNLKKATVDVEAYWNTLTRPPIRAYLPDWVVQKLYEFMTSAKLTNNPQLRFKLTNELLLPWGFKPLASGTNRRAFYCTYDPGIIIKIASDAVGQKDNQSEFVIQQMLRPFCPKIFDVAGDGAIALSERGEPMTEHDYKFVWANEIFDLLFSLLARGYILEDVGSNFYKNFGIRMGFGPMLWDFPYVYKLDWRKLICQKPDPITGEPCGGEIDYDYNKGMSEIICTKCGARYSAKYLADSMPAEAFSFVNRERRCIRVGRFDNQFDVFVRKGDQIIATFTNETSTTQPQVAPRRNLLPGENPDYMNNVVITQQPMNPQAAAIVANAIKNGLVMDQSMINGTNQLYAGNTGTSVTVETVRQDAVAQNVVAPYGAIPNAVQTPPNYILGQQTTVPGKVIATPHKEDLPANGSKGIMITPEEFIALIATCQAAGKEIPISLIQAAPDLAAPMLQNQQPLPVKDFEYYYDENGKKLMKYPQSLKGQIGHWLNNMYQKFGVNIAVMLAEKLEIEFNPKKTPKPQDPPAPPPPSTTPKPQSSTTNDSFPRIMPGVGNKPQGSKPKVIARVSPQQIQSQVTGTTYTGIGHQMVQQSAVETVIAPRPQQRMLDVENPNTWKALNSQPTTVATQPIDQPQVQTSNLFPVKPMTREEKEAADAQVSKETAITGFPGVAMVDSLRFKSEVPKIRKAVEARFGDFPLSVEDADRQVAEMAAKIEDFVANDIATVMGTDTKGIEVSVVRTTDHCNNDCFKVEVSNYKSPVFMTVIYPSNEKVDEALVQDMQQNSDGPIQQEHSEEMQIPQQELEQFFATNFQEFDASNCHSAEDVKNELTAFLVSKLLDTYNGDGTQRITVPRAYKEANAYVEQAVEIKEKPTTNQQQPPVVPPQPAPQMVAGSAGASL